MVRRPRRHRWLAAVSIVVVLGAAAVVGATVAGWHGPRRHRSRSLYASAYPALAGRRSRPRAGEGSAEGRRLLALGRPVYCAGRRGDEVALTFDDGPGLYTRYAVQKLTAARDQATFFVVGKSIKSWHGWLRRELKVGALGDHTYTHPDLLQLPLHSVTRQLAQTARLIQAQAGEHVQLWRPPYEASDGAIERIASRLGLLEILWDVDSRDWAGASWEQIIKNVEAGLRPGAIVLMHENHGQTIRALTTLLPNLHRRHLRSVSVPQLLLSDPPSAAQLRRGMAGCGNSPRPGMGRRSGG